MYDLRMSRGASTVVNTCAGVQPGEQVLIITEHSKMSIAESLAAASYAAGAEATLAVMTPRDLDGQEPPAAVAAAMRASDVFLCAVSRSITHTHAVREATAAGARGLVLTQFTEGMMVRGGIQADFRAIAPRCRAMAAALSYPCSAARTSASTPSFRLVAAPGSFLTSSLPSSSPFTSLKPTRSMGVLCIALRAI